ncbi:MAG TPA: efflux RND transporter permease subunit [Spirochaetota bacterium]|nr:efflux RND transporter permease subunit [Spirochaetota bacterium]
MNIAKLAIKRPVFISCIVLIIMIVGMISYFRIGVELMPDISFPTIGVVTSYSGASPDEIEQLITKPLEDELGTISGLKHLSSSNTEGLSIITMEFDMEIDVDRVVQDVRDKVSIAMNSLPDDLESDPVIQKFDPGASSVIRLALLSDLPPAEMYGLAKETIKPQIERIKDVGNVEISGGSSREIQVEIDQDRLNEYTISMTRVVSSLNAAGSNIPIGTKEREAKKTVFRSMGEFVSLEQIRNTLVSFTGDVGIFVNVESLGTVRDGVEDTTSTGYIHYPENLKSKTPGRTQSCVYLDVIKQSGKNTVEVTDSVKAMLESINNELKQGKGHSQIIVTSDQSEWIKTNVNETISTIIIGIILAILVVYLFLGNIRSTVITAIAIPNSLLGAVIIMNVTGYTFNMMTLMALSLVVGLLVDDAIVVRENIFRKLEHGMNPFRAAELGTREVMLAVIATTLAIISVFFPIGMLSGVIGKVFKQFGFTVVFAMIVSLFDALTVAPFLSAYFAGDGKKSDNIIVTTFERFQSWMDRKYGSLMNFCLNRPLVVIIITTAVFLSSIALVGMVKKTFFPSGDRGEFAISIEMPAGTSLAGTTDTVKQIEEKLKDLTDIDYYSVSIGNSNGEVTKAEIHCKLLEKRKRSTDENKERTRTMLVEFSYARPSVNSTHGGGGADSPFVIIVSGRSLDSVEKAAEMIKDQVRTIPDLVDADTTIKKGSPEFRVYFDSEKMQGLGVSTSTAGAELRYGIAGSVVGSFRENGVEYDIRARLKPEQRDLEKNFYKTRVANNSNKMVPLNMVARGEQATGTAEINRRDKAYIIKVTANTAQGGAIGSAMTKASELITKNVQLPQGVTYSFSGESETLAETASSIMFALVMAIIFIYLVLASLYESFITPFVILLAVPPALTGALFALLITGFMMDMFSMIGMVMLMGLVTKNSILLVDNAVHGVQAGLDRKQAVLEAGQRRLRPILMTTFAMLAGMLPLAMGIGEAAQMRQSMGISIMGGLIISTLVTLIVVPAVFEFVDKFREATEGRILVREKE